MSTHFRSSSKKVECINNVSLEIISIWRFGTTTFGLNKTNDPHYINVKHANVS